MQVGGGPVVSICKTKNQVMAAFSKKNLQKYRFIISEWTLQLQFILMNITVVIFMDASITVVNGVLCMCTKNPIWQLSPKRGKIS